MIVPSNFQIVFEVYVFTKENFSLSVSHEYFAICIYIGYHFLNIVYVYNTIEIWETDKVNFFHKI